MDLLTTAEAAAYLRIKERKLYELVAEGAIPCSKVTGRWLFPRTALDRWVAAGLVGAAGGAPADPPPIIGGSHDGLLEWALRESRSGLASLAEGSEAGLARLVRGEVLAAAIHLHALDDPTADENLRTLAAGTRLADTVLIGLVEREQGFLVAAGNPLALASIADAAARGARLAQRPRGAGAQLLLIALAAREGLALDALTLVPDPCPTGGDVAQAIRSGRADCGVATRAVAEAAALSFVPVLWERFDLIMRQRDYFRPPMQALMRLVRAPAFADRAREMGGYRADGAGQVRAVR